MNPAVMPAAALAAGLVSATSPCIIPVIPGFLASVSDDPSGLRAGRGQSVRAAIGFVAGFTAVFAALGATASALGSLLFEHLTGLTQLAGVLLVVMGLQTSGLLRSRRLDRERRPIALNRAAETGRARSVVLGIVFAIGWTPCIGPVLATILTKAAIGGSLLQGVVLLLLYSIGLGLPFVGVAYWFDGSARLRRWLGAHGTLIQRVGGAVMVVAGIAYLTGAWSDLFTAAQRELARLGWPPI
jgi:cytochrome c-type biogenesis protein